MYFGALLKSGQRRIKLLELMAAGVVIPCEESVFVSVDCTIGKGTLILPGCVILEGSVIGENCVIGPNSVISNTKISDDVEFLQSWSEDAEIASSVLIGPFARIRPGTRIKNGVKIGNFVEIKNSDIGKGCKLPHLSYIGDTDMGECCNIGCGCATANYDGRRKHRTQLEPNCFIGCDTTLVAPVTLGGGTYTAAGSVITHDVPEKTLVIARARQINKNGGSPCAE